MYHPKVSLSSSRVSNTEHEDTIKKSCNSFIAASYLPENEFIQHHKRQDTAVYVSDRLSERASNILLKGETDKWPQQYRRRAEQREREREEGIVCPVTIAQPRSSAVNYWLYANRHTGRRKQLRLEKKNFKETFPLLFSHKHCYIANELRMEINSSKKKKKLWGLYSAQSFPWCTEVPRFHSDLRLWSRLRIERGD